MAGRNPGSAITEYCLCGALIAIISISALAGLGVTLGSVLHGVELQLSALQGGQSDRIPIAPPAPGILQPITGLPGTGGSVNGDLPSGIVAHNPDTAIHAPITDTTGANGSVDQTPLVSGSNPPGTTSPPKPVTTPGKDDPTPGDEPAYAQKGPPVIQGWYKP